MGSRSRLRSVLALVLILVLAACQQAPGRSGGSTGNAAAPAQAAPKRVVGVIMGDPPHFAGRFNPSIGSVPGLWELEEMVNAGMANFDQEGSLRPQLAEAVPSLDNGLWKVFPDGRMETTWKIRQGAVWHDGTPFTSADLMFTALTGNDKEVPGFAN